MIRETRVYFNTLGKGKVSVINLHLPLLIGTGGRVILARETKEHRGGVLSLVVMVVLKQTDTFNRGKKHSALYDVGSLLRGKGMISAINMLL